MQLLSAILGMTVGLAAAEIRTITFLPKIISENPTLNGMILGQYHPTYNTSIADLFGPGGDIFPSDYAFLAGESSSTLSFVWNRNPLKAIFLDEPNKPLIVERRDNTDYELLDGLYIEGDNHAIINTANLDFKFTACKADPEDWHMPQIYVSYLPDNATKIADNCSIFQLVATDRTSRYPYADDPKALDTQA